MAKVELFVIDHRAGDHQPAGKIIRPFIIKPTDAPGERYADFCALTEVWRLYAGFDNYEPPTHVGFFGYRKYLWLPGYMFIPDPAHAPNWWSVDQKTFDAYRTQLAQEDGANIAALLAQHDILVAPPFPLGDTYILEDFMASRSEFDGYTMLKVLEKAGVDTHVKRIFPYLFITRWSVFNRMMNEIETIRQELDGRITAEDSSSAAYKHRPMAYVMERVFSLWVEGCDLSIKELPLLHCWEKQ